MKKTVLLLGLAGALWSPCFLFSLDFLQAVELNRITDVRRMVNEGADVNQSDRMGYTALHIASWNGSVELVEYLLQMGANPNTITPQGNTALKFANEPIKNLLLRYGAYKASAQAPTVIIQQAPIQRQAPAPLPSTMGQAPRPIVRVVSNFVSNIVRNTTIISNLGYPHASYEALKNRRPDETALLYRWDSAGNNSLHRAAQEGDINSITNLIAQGVNPLSRNNAGHTALHFAVENGHLPVIRYLIETVGLDINAGSNNGTSPVTLAAMSGRPDILGYTIRMGGNVNASSTVTVLRTSSEGGAAQETAVTGWTPLMAAAQTGDTEALRTLADAGASLNSMDKEGYNALMYAVQGESLPAVRTLVDRGINYSAVSKDGSTALSIAIDQNSQDIVSYLQGIGAPDTKNPRFDVDVDVDEQEIFIEEEIPADEYYEEEILPDNEAGGY